MRRSKRTHRATRGQGPIRQLEISILDARIARVVRVTVVVVWSVILAVSSLLGLALVPLGQVHIGFGIAGAVLAALTGALGLTSRRWHVVRVGILTLLLAVVGALGVPFTIWAVVGVIAITGRWVPVLRPDRGWIPRGVRTPAEGWLTGLVVVGAGVGLILWATSTSKFGTTTSDLADRLKDVPLSGLVPLLAVFVVINAVTEEVAYRGIALDAAREVFPSAFAVIVSAVAFGTLHVNGFPAGAVGVVLAFFYGLVLGTIRVLTRGLRMPILAHIAADITIAVSFVAVVLPQ